MMENRAPLMMNVGVLSLLCLAGTACTPRVEVATPDKPITINLNVKIDHQIRVKVDKELDQVLSQDSGLF
jgi:YnbE-like lipoprotein